MANNVVVTSIERPKVDVLGSAGEAAGTTDAAYLRVTLDRFGTGRIVATHILQFADYAGLQTEWEAGVATTVLEAALDDAIANDVVWPTDPLNATQRAVLTTYSYAEA